MPVDPNRESWKPGQDRLGAIVGTPEEAAPRLAEYAEAGVDRVNITLRPPWDWQSLEAFADKVMPSFGGGS